MGLWYPGSMGQPATTAVSSSWHGNGLRHGLFRILGTCATAAPASASSTADHPIGFSDVTDGLSNTLMAGETIPSQCTFNGAYNQNFPVAGTTIPLNTDQLTEQGVNNLWYIGCGFKSRHARRRQFRPLRRQRPLLNASIDYQLYNNLGTRNGNEAVAVP